MHEYQEQRLALIWNTHILQNRVAAGQLRCDVATEQQWSLGSL